MYLGHLSLRDFRSYAEVELPLEPGVTAFVGPNGQGKTNLVEAVGYLATLGSHRVAADAPLVRLGADRAVVRGQVVRGDRALLVEVELSPGRANRARVNRAAVPRARDVLGILRTVLFAPEDLALVKGDPGDRRRYLDDLLTTRTPRLAGVRADYDRVLKQRTALLKSAAGRRSAGRTGADLSTLDVWDAHLATSGASLLAARLELVQALHPLVDKNYAAVAAPPVAGEPTQAGEQGGAGEPMEAGEPRVDVEPSVDPDPRVASGPIDDEAVARDERDRQPAAPGPALITYRSSLGEGAELVADRTVLEQALLAALRERRDAELDRGVCLVGPHRDDLVLSLGPVPAKGYASHGESWSFALALRLAAYDLLRAESDDGGEPVLILDDVFAELDGQRRDRLAALVGGAEQVLVTAAVEADVPSSLTGARVDVLGSRVRRVR